MHTYDPSHDQLMELINAADDAVSEIRSLSQLGEVIDGNVAYFSHCMTLLAIINERAGHLDKLLSQIAYATLPRPQRMEGAAR